MGNPPGWVWSTKLEQPHGKVDGMAGLSAGVVGAADVNSQPKAPTRMSMKFNDPATWAYIWVSAAFLYLVFTYMGILSLRRIG